MKPNRPGGRRKPTHDQMLRAVPYRNEKLELRRGADGGCVATVPVRRPRWLVPPVSWLLPFSSVRRVELDSVGAEVLDLCDGKRSIESIIENFAANHKLSFREAQLPISSFMQQLVERGLVAIVGLR
jgi:hypothetical protein